MRPFLLLVSLLIFSSSYSQKKESLTLSDSVSRRIELSRQKIRELEDSLDRIEIRRSIEQNGKNLERFLADMKAQKERERRQVYLRIGLGVVFFAVLIVGAMRRRKKLKNNR